MQILKYILLVLVFTFTSNFITVTAQCNSWVGSNIEEDATNAHSIYRQALKSNDYTLAFEQWQIAYDLAPAADGKRDYHYTDGVKLYLKKLETETDDAKKMEYREKIYELYDGAIACYASGIIVTKSCNSSESIIKKTGFLRGRQAYNMFYYMRSSYTKTLAILKESVDNAGKNSEYSVMAPYSSILVDLYTKKKVEKEVVVEAYDLLNNICDYNIEHNKTYGTYYDQAKKSMNSKFAKIESEIFDCNYFVKKYAPQYEMDPENIDQLKLFVARFKKQECSGSEDPFIMKIEAHWKTYVETHNAEAQAEFDAKNPGSVAKKLFDNGNYTGAINKYKEAIQLTDDIMNKAKYQKTIASILFRKLGRYNEARTAAKKAAALKPGWGAPYMLIGDMYGKSARSCGDSWNQRLAILAAIDKYRYAKSIDSSVASDAQKRINTYSKSKPTKEDVFQRGLKAGQTAKVGCWIGENVKISTN